jgi:hypothetical protein
MTNPLTAAHAEAIKQRTAARRHRARLAQPLERAQDVAGQARAELEAARRAEQATTDAHAERLASAIVAGCDRPAATLVIDEHPRRSAETRAAIADKALEAVSAQYAEALAALQAAEAAVAAAADAILGAETLELARRFVKARETFYALGEELKAATPDEINRPLNQPINFHPEVKAALALLPPEELMVVPVNRHHAWGSPEARAQWAERRRALIEGDDTTDPAPHEAAA